MLYKVIVILITKWNSLIAAIYNELIIKSSGVSYLSKPRINGRVIVKNKGEIILGSNVLMNNSSESNPVGLPHPTILCTQHNDAKIEIGDNVGISGASIVAFSSISIGDRTLIGGGVGIWDTDFHPLDPEKRKEHPTKDAKSAPIVIKEDVFIGARAIILKGVTIGRGAVIGAGAVVANDVPDFAVAYGNPLIINKTKY